VKAVGYFRDPPAGQTGGATLASQSQSFLDYCEQHGYEVVGTFVDPAAAADQERPGFRQLVEFLRRPDKGFVVVVAYSPQDLGGGLRQAARSYFQLDGLGAQLAFLDGSEDATATLLKAWTSQSGAHRLGERVQTAMRRKAVKGEVLGRPPYGYKVGSRRRLELVPEEAVVVRYIFRLYLQEGLGIRLIARRLNEEGLRTRRGGHWSMVSIRDILRNRAYLGTYSRFGVRVPGSHPALISPDDFRRVQEQLASRRTSFSPRHASPFLLSGLAYCGYCGNKMIGVSRHQSWQRRRDGGRGEADYRYYQCESRTNQSLCDYHTHRAEELHEQVRQALSEIDPATSLAVPQAGDERAVLAEWRSEERRLQTRLRQLDRRMEDYINAAAHGRMTADRMRALSVKVAADRLKVEDELAEIGRRAQQHLSATERREAQRLALNQLQEKWDSLPFAGLSALLREVVERIIVKDDGIQALLRP
jgi:site-specific DNA recombinase